MTEQKLNELNLIDQNRVRTSKLAVLVDFLGKKVAFSFALMILLGLMWFAIETSFILVLQIFLKAIGLVTEIQLGEFLSPYQFDLLESVLLLIGFGVFRAVIQGLSVYNSNLAGQKFINVQRKRILNLSLLSEFNISTSQAVDALNERALLAARSIEVFSSLVLNSVTAIFLISFGFYLAPLEMIVGLVSMVVLLFPLKMVNSGMQKISREIVEKSTKINHLLIECIKNSIYIKVTNMQFDKKALAHDYIDQYLDNYRKYGKIAGTRQVAPLIAGTLCIGAIAYVGSEYSDTSPIKLISFFYVFLRISQLLSQAINNYTSLKLNMPSVRLLFDLYEIEKKIDGREQLNSKTKKPENAPTLDFKKLEVRNLAFGYNKDSLISGVDLNVLAGDFVLIKGESGSGKSTFLKLVLGLITPTSGEIKVNETPLLNMKWDFLETIGYVGPENNLIQGTIRDNLLYGLKRSVSESEIHEALSHAKILQKIKSLPNGLDTVLSEKIELSSGQQQRIALARALVRKPSILILDEATSNLDIETESEFLDSIHQLNLSKITVIAVSHRATYDRFANRTFTCKMGKITESH